MNRICLILILSVATAIAGPRGSFDALSIAATTSYAAASGATDKLPLCIWGAYTRQWGLWPHMVCWPLRSSQNAGTGTTAYSLGGLGSYPGTLVNGPTWGASGVYCDGADDYVDMNFVPDSAASNSLFAVHRPTVDQAQDLLGCRNAAYTGGYDAVRRGVTSGDRKGEFYAYGATDFSAYVVVSGAEALNVSHVYCYIADHIAKKVGFAGDEMTAFTLSGVGAETFTATDRSLKLSSFGGLAGGGSAGDYGFFANFSGVVLGDSEYVALYSLYKSTIGQGLGLP